MKKILAVTFFVSIVISLHSQSIEFVKDDIMNKYMKSGFSDKKFKPKGKTDNELKQGKWKDYEVISDYSYCLVNKMPKQIFGQYLIYGEGNFVDGKRDGEWTFFTIEDKSFKKISHKKMTYVNGILHGKFEYYYPEGLLGIMGHFDKGELEGKVISYYPNGQNYGIRIYKNGKKNGTQTYKYPNGKIELQHTFKNGIKNSLYQTFYPNGQLKEEFNYKIGKEDGIYRYYYENGQLWIEKVYQNGLLMEVNGSYSENGEERNKGSISHGNGTVNYYTADGKVYNVQTFKEGVKLSEEKK